MNIQVQVTCFQTLDKPVENKPTEKKEVPVDKDSTDKHK